MYTRNSENDKFEKVNLTNVLQSTLDLCSEKLTNNNIKLIYKNDNNYYTFGKKLNFAKFFLISSIIQLMLLLLCLINGFKLK